MTDEFNSEVSVSVTLLTRNAGPLLGRVLQAVRGQDTDRVVEIVAVDSGSTDGTADVLREFDARVDTIPSDTFNFGRTQGFDQTFLGGGRVKLALFMGNRYNAWHLQGFRLLRGEPSITAFRVDSQIQAHFSECGEGTEGFVVERVRFDTQAGNPVVRTKNVLLERYRKRVPRVLPFYQRLRGFDLIHSWELFTDWSAEALKARERFSIPLAITVWDLIPFNMERDAERRDIKKRVAERADRFIVYTDRSRRTLEIKGIARERITRVNPGIDTEVFSPGEVADRDNEEFRILFVGWLVPRKGIDFLLLALRDLIRDPARGEDLGKRARTRVVEHFDVKGHADALSDVYESLLR